MDFEIRDNILFRYKGNAEHVVIPYGVTTIEGSAFYGCSSLKSVEIPGSVQLIGESAFGQCSN
jgi:hypothetical protein